MEIPQNKLDQDILALLIVSKLPVVEKTVWKNLLLGGDMTEEEKKELSQNLTQEVEYEMKAEAGALKQFSAALEKISQ